MFSLVLARQLTIARPALQLVTALSASFLKNVLLEKVHVVLVQLVAQ